MSKDIIVLTPNGRRQKVHCTPNTTFLQVLEDVCQKQGFQPNAYDLKHHKNILDLTTPLRFSNLPNKACLEMVESERKREESNVTIGLTLEDGERRMADFLPSVSLYDIASSLAPKELEVYQNPTMLYMRHEIVGVSAMKDKTLRQLGLLGGRAVLRLLNKSEEQAVQANVSSVYRAKPQPKPEKVPEEVKDVEMKDVEEPKKTAEPTPNTDKDQKDSFKQKPLFVNPIEVLKQKKMELLGPHHSQPPEDSHMSSDDAATSKLTTTDTTTMETDPPASSSKKDKDVSKESLERRLLIDNEVTFIGENKAIAFTQPDEIEQELEDLPDDFYDLSVEEVRRLYSDLQKQRAQLENAPLMFASHNAEIQKEETIKRENTYKNAVIRIQFPDTVILQGVFSPNDKIEDVVNFVKSHLSNPERDFQLYTTPLKESLDPKLTLVEAKFVPCVHFHFKWLTGDTSGRCLKEDIYSKLTSGEAAGILASKYRAPSRRKMDEASTSAGPSSAKPKSSKIPKWFK